jgi:hypothetical protein
MNHWIQRATAVPIAATLLALGLSETSAGTKDTRAAAPVICEFDDNHHPPEATRDGTEAQCLKRLPNLARRTGDVLTLRLANGKVKVFRTLTAGCESAPILHKKCISYWLSAYDPRANAFVVKVGFYEGGHIVLVSSRTGNETKLSTFPRFSPSGQHFVSVDASDMGSRDYDVAIWAAGEPPTSEGMYEEAPGGDYESWEFVRWDGEDHIILRVAANSDGTGYRTYDAEARRLNGGWQLRKLGEVRQ